MLLLCCSPPLAFAFAFGVVCFLLLLLCRVSAGPSILVVLLRMWSEPLNWAQMEFLPVMAPLAEELPAQVDCAVFARRVRKRMAEGLGVPCTEHSYEDVS